MGSDLFVYAYVEGQAVPAGTFSREDGEGRFSYDEAFLANPGSYALDPLRLPLRPGTFTCRTDDGYFGVFLDGCAQEWGRRIMHQMAQSLPPDRREAFLAGDLSADNALLALGSGYGSGCLRFSPLPGLEADALEPVIPGIDIQDVEGVIRLADVLTRADANLPISEEEALLLLPAMSLGGSRPKTLVTHHDAQWIAKFWRPREQADIQRVELAVNHLAAACGIEIADAAAEVVECQGEQRTIFLSRRFDRDASGAPIHYISAASLLGAPRSTRGIAGNVDPSAAQARFSYMDIAQMIRRTCRAPAHDLRELYRRMIFNMLVGNRDDHLCNHGFLHVGQGQYRLAPAFDLALTPNPPADHPIMLGEHGRVATIENALSRAGEFGQRPAQAREIIEQVAAGLSQWSEVAKRCQLAPDDIAWAANNMQLDTLARWRVSRAPSPEPRSVSSAELAP